MGALRRGGGFIVLGGVYCLPLGVIIGDQETNKLTNRSMFSLFVHSPTRRFPCFCVRSLDVFPTCQFARSTFSLSGRLTQPATRQPEQINKIIARRQPEQINNII